MDPSGLFTQTNPIGTTHHFYQRNVLSIAFDAPHKLAPDGTLVVARRLKYAPYARLGLAVHIVLWPPNAPASPLSYTPTRGPKAQSTGSPSPSSSILLSFVFNTPRTPTYTQKVFGRLPHQSVRPHDKAEVGKERVARGNVVEDEDEDAEGS